MTDLPEPKNGACVKCGEQDLMRAVDSTVYEQVFFEEGEWRVSYLDDETGRSARLFCDSCGQQHAVPKELQ